MNKVTATVDVKTVEFLLDLPTEFAITDIRLEDGKVFVSFETELEVPENVEFQYETDEFGNIAMTGLNV
jgi:hypothetical protein